MSRWELGVTILIVCLLATRSLQQTITIQGFVESDALTNEGDDLSVVVDATNSNGRTVSVVIRPMTFEEYNNDLSDADKAVCENSRFSDAGGDHAEASDFNGTAATKELMDTTANFIISVLNDAVQEPNEVFVIYLSSNDSNVAIRKQCIRVEINADSNDNVVLRAMIMNPLVTEDVGQITAVQFTREGETEFPIIINLNSLFGSSDGQKNVDYTIDAPNDQLVLRPEDISVDLLVTVIDDTVGEYDEFISLSASWSFESGPGGANDADIKITIVDDDYIQIGFINDTSVTALEGETIKLCAASDASDIYPEERFNDLIFIDTLEVTAIADKHFTKTDLGFGTPSSPSCVSLEMVDDNILEESRDFQAVVSVISAGLIPNRTASDLYTFQRERVTVHIRDNDGVPNKPDITEFKPTATKNEIVIVWTTLIDGLRPVESYTIRFRAYEGDPTKEDEIRVVNVTVEADVTRLTFEITDLEKIYDVKICAVNEFGVTCSDVDLVQVTAVPLVPDESGLPKGALIGIIVGAIILAVCCCLCVILLLVCLYWCGEREKNYFPANREKKYAQQYEKYRSKRETSTLSGESLSDDNLSA